MEPVLPPVTPTPLPAKKLNWRERYSAILLLLLGIIYLALQVSALLSSQAAAYSMEQEKLVVSKTELFNDIRSYTSILLCLLASILLFLKKRMGWIIGFSVLLLFTGLMAVLWYSMLGTGIVLNIAALGVSVLIFLLGFLFLLPGSTRRKFSLNGSSYLYAFILTGVLALLYFWLQ